MTRRLFVALEVSFEVHTILAEAQTLLADGVPSDAVRWQQQDAAHLTLVFLGPVADSDLPFCRSAVAKVAGRHEPFDLETSTLGAFPSFDRPSVLWLGVRDPGLRDPLQALHRSLAVELAAVHQERRDRSFRPHLTLGRVTRRGTDPSRFRALLESYQPAPVGWSVSELILFESVRSGGGPKYRVQLRAPLSKARQDGDHGP